MEVCSSGAGTGVAWLNSEEAAVMEGEVKESEEELVIEDMISDVSNVQTSFVSVKARGAVRARSFSDSSMELETRSYWKGKEPGTALEKMSRHVLSDGEEDVDRLVEEKKASDFSKLAPKARRKIQVPGAELVFLAANRVYYSKAYSVLYASMILLNLCMLLWIAYSQGQPQSSFFVCLEIVVTIALGLEVAIKMATQRNSYWGRASNWFDFFVLVLCIASLFIFQSWGATQEEEESEAEHVDELMASGLLVTRYLIQGLRLVVLLRNRQRMLELTSGIGETFVDDVDFALLNDPDLDLDVDMHGVLDSDTTNATSENRTLELLSTFGGGLSRSFSFGSNTSERSEDVTSFLEGSGGSTSVLDDSPAQQAHGAKHQRLSFGMPILDAGPISFRTARIGSLVSQASDESHGKKNDDAPSTSLTTI